MGRNMLSTITSRKLAAPSVPLTLYPTSPSDFAEDDVESLKSSGTSSKTSVRIFFKLSKSQMKRDLPQ